MTPSRRALLRSLAGTGLALPFLEITRPTVARAAVGTPKRLVVAHHRQGTVLRHWLPTGSEHDFTLGSLLAPLAPFQDRLVVVAGVDNWLNDVNPFGDAHYLAETSILTANVYQDLSESKDSPRGPSIDAVLAERLSGSCPFDRLDFAVGGHSATGYETSNEFWHGPDDPVVFTNDPDRWFTRLFAPDALDAEAVAALRARRASVLDVVKDAFGSLRGRLGVADRLRLDAHLERVRSLERRVTAPPAECTPPASHVPPEYSYMLDDHHTSPLMIELMVEALACGQTAVANLLFASHDTPSWHFLVDAEGRPRIPLDEYGNWHNMVHSGREEPGLLDGFGWYAEQIALLLERLSGTLGPDGLPLLDTTCVLWSTDFGNGIEHNLYKIPYVFAGNLGHVPTGRFVDHMTGGPDDDWVRGDKAHGQVLTSMLRMFGGDDETFGYVSPEIPSGPLPGL